MSGRLKQEAESSTTEVAPSVGQSRTPNYLPYPFIIRSWQPSGIQQETMVSCQAKSLLEAQKEYGGAVQKIQHMNGKRLLATEIEEMVARFAPDKWLTHQIHLKRFVLNSPRSGIRQKMEN
jgi:hypothetical protein